MQSPTLHSVYLSIVEEQRLLGFGWQQTSKIKTTVLQFMLGAP